LTKRHNNHSATDDLGSAFCYTYLKKKEEVMEFDHDTPANDEQRRLAEAKKITLQPIHADIQPDETRDSEIAAHHLASPAIANIPNDIEQDTVPIQPSKGLLGSQSASSISKGRVGAVAIIALPVIAIAAICAYLLLR
jgi:hypothetical protein